ncbi:288_t:CDS:10, partial [Scutellospora calospora]
VTTHLRHGSSVSKELNKYSKHITQPKSQGAAQAVLYGTGLELEDMNKAQVGIASLKKIKEGVKEAGLIGYRFNTIGVSDAISMGTTGMRYSLQSRDLIADSIETIMGGQWYDANISVPGCDKNMPGCLIAMGRLNRPSLMVYGGTIRPGRSSCGKDILDIISAFQSYGLYITGSISEEKRFDIVKHACPGPGACGGMYTANTMASAIEALGMTLPYSSSIPAEYPEKFEECLNAGLAIRNLLEQDIKPRDIMTRKAFENAMVITMILGGSTNAVLHLIAIAKSVGVDLKLDDFQKVSDSTPFLADLKPRYTLFPITGFCLGTWQIQRLRWKVGLIEEYEERLSKPQMILPKKIKLEVLNDYLFRRVKTFGKFLHDQEMLLGPRTFDNKHGYFIITPLERENGTTVLVKRGWISKEKANPSTRKNSQPEEIVNIEGLLKKSEKKNWFTPKNNPDRNEWLWTDIETMAERTGAQPVLIEQSLEGSPYLINQMIEDGIPIGKIPSVELRNTHLQYAITWYSLAVATSIMFYILLKKPPAGHYKRKVMQG